MELFIWIHTFLIIGSTGLPFTTKADKDGNWIVELNPASVDKWTAFQVFGKNNSINISNVVYGDVFLCIGDGNRSADNAISIYVDQIAYRVAAQIARIGPVIYTTFNSSYYRGPQLYG